MLLLPADYWIGVLALAGRETQDFASLLGGRRRFDVVEWGACGLWLRRDVSWTESKKS